MPSLPNLDPAIANAAYIELHATLPWLFEDTAAETLERCRAALGTIDGLRPATAVEARFAVQMVAADITAGDCVRQAGELAADFTKASRCRAQATAMMRLTHRALNTLLQLQRQRRHESSLAAAAASLYAPARPPEPPQAASEPSAAPPVAPLAAPSAAPGAEASEQPPDTAAPPTAARFPDAPPAAPAAESAAPVDPIPQVALHQAAAFIRQNRQLALRIRRAGGLTAESARGFRPSSLPQDPAVIEALVHGTGPLFESLDGGTGGERHAA